MRSLTDCFEWVIWRARLFIAVAVVAGIVASLLMVVVGSISVIDDVGNLAHMLSSNGLEFTQRTLIINAVNAMDTFLIATVLFIFSIGLYELFIREIHVAKSSSKELLVNSLDQLKEKLAKVILMVLFVTFFKYAISMTYKTTTDLIYLAIAILLISLAMFLGHLKFKKTQNTDH
ncbi:MAG: YqhA family protein [Gammaproteobacteria bacterium]|nr:YqhA family protein [Gammaproteobacteria bacterium]